MLQLPVVLELSRATEEHPQQHSQQLTNSKHGSAINMVRKFVLCAILALVTSFAPVAPPKPPSTVVRSEPPKTSTPPINRATALSGGLLGGYLLLELGYGAYNSTKE